METVNIARCTSYEQELVKSAVFSCLDGIEGIKEKARNKRILVKANLLKKNAPEDAVTTHPVVVEAIVSYLQQLGCTVIIGDSPGGPYTEKALRGIYQASGMNAVAERTGCELNYDTSVAEVENNKAAKLKLMQIINVAEKVDYVVSAAKLKTHGMMTYTGAVKNLFGVIPGLVKVDYHFKMNDVDNFADHLLDICEYVNPLFSVIDGVEAMEGDGPSSGEKRQVGLILAASNPHALDTVAVNIAGIKAAAVPTIWAARERQIFSGDMRSILINGVQLKDIQIPPFKLPKSVTNTNFIGGKVPKFMENYALNAMRPKPVFKYEDCISCGDCKRLCPAKTIEMKDGKPVIQLENCIRCFCCHELCPQKAIDIKKHWAYDTVFKYGYSCYELIHQLRSRRK